MIENRAEAIDIRSNTYFFAAAFLGAAFFGETFLAAAFFGAAFLATAFLATAFLATAFLGVDAFFRAAFFAAFLAGFAAFFAAFLAGFFAAFFTTGLRPAIFRFAIARSPESNLRTVREPAQDIPKTRPREARDTPGWFVDRSP